MSNDSMNTDQQEAVETTEGPVLIIAGAGSGKTYTLARRVAHLIQKGVPSESILLLTFTRKSANEMISRAVRYSDDRCRKISGGTFHSFANFLLRKYGDNLGYNRNFTIIDESDAADIIQRIREESGFVTKDKRFPKKDTIRNIISARINTGKELLAVIEEDYPQYVSQEEQIRQIGSFYHDYKKKRNLMDYDDLLVNLLALLRDHEHIRTKAGTTYKYIMVDEFQDTNKIQGHISALLGSHGNILVVGDDTQCIYSFRGSTVRNILDFPKLFPESRIIKLEKNYRSTKALLAFSNAIIDNIKEKHEKKLYSDFEEGNKPKIVKLKNEREQSEYICDRILELRENGIDLNRMSVLMRSGWHSNDLEIELANRKIPFKKFGGRKFIEASHIKDVIMFFRVLHNITDTLAWGRILLLFEGIGHKTADQIIDEIITIKQFEGLVLPEFTTKRYSPHLQKLYELFTSIKSGKSAVPEIMEDILQIYRPLMKERYDDYLKREKDLKTFLSICERFESVDDFLTSMSLEPPTDIHTMTLPDDKEDEFLTLSTVHSAKGLEWHSVFVLHMIDGLFPSSFTTATEEEIDEERRLFYVAATRAEKNLYLMNPGFVKSGWRDGFDFSLPSRFIEEMPNIDELTEQISIQPQKANPMDSKISAINDFFK